MPSPADVAKRDLVKLLKTLAVKYGVQLEVTRDSCEKDVVKAWRKLSLKLHPDKGGDAQDFAKLSAANDAWQDLLKSKGSANVLQARTLESRPSGLAATSSEESARSVDYCPALVRPDVEVPTVH